MNLTQINSILVNDSKLTEKIATLAEQVARQQTIITEKDRTIERQATEIATLKAKITAHPQSEPRNRRVQPELSRLLRDMYPSLKAEEKFKLNEAYDSEANKEVMLRLQAMLELESSMTFDKQKIDHAIRLRFYNERRMKKENSEAATTRRRVARRHSKLQARTKAATKLNLHVQLMKELTADDMSDEVSLDGSEEGFKVKQPQWRDESITKSLSELDKKAKDYNKVQLPRKRRILGSPSTRLKKAC